MNDQLIIYDDPEKTMEIVSVAKSLNVSPRTIRRYVEKLFPGRMVDGVKTKLTEMEVTAIKLDLEKNKHLDTSVQLPKTALEKKLLVKQAYDILNEEIEELRVQLEEARPKIEFHDQVGDSEGLLSIGETAKMLSYGRNTFFTMLRKHKIFMGREPYQEFINRGYFKLKTTTKNDHIQKQSFVTGKGLQWLQVKF